MRFTQMRQVEQITRKVPIFEEVEMHIEEDTFASPGNESLILKKPRCSSAAPVVRIKRAACIYHLASDHFTKGTTSPTFTLKNFNKILY